jgi:hypothetical protein
MRFRTGIYLANAVEISVVVFGIIVPIIAITIFMVLIWS